MPTLLVIVPNPGLDDRLQFVERPGVQQQRAVFDLEATDEALHLGVVMRAAERIGDASTVAEKLHTMVLRSLLNSRMRDFFDVWALARQFDFEGGVLLIT
jgi:hypothetical protein